MAHPNYIKMHIRTVPELLRDCAETMYQRVKNTLEDEKLEQTQMVVMTGCGYSYAAACNGAEFIEKIAGIPARALYSVDASRHQSLAVLPKGEQTLFIGVSGSGVVARVAEGLMRFRTKGVYAVAFSGDMQSKCARAAQVTVDISTPTVNIERGLPLRGYAATLLAFCGVAWRIAILQGRKSEAERLAFYEDLVVSADELQKTLPEIEHQVSDFARKVYQTASVYELVGSGTGFISAWLGRQELVGQAGVFGVECSAEDWLHSTFFATRPETIPTVLISPPNSPARSRLEEVEGYMAYLRRPLCVIGQSISEATSVINLPYTDNELLNPFLEIAPVSLLAGEICELTGEEDSRGFRERWDFSKGGAATENSEIVILN